MFLNKIKSYSSVSQETIDIVKQKYEELQELIEVLGIDKSAKDIRLQNPRDERERYAKILEQLDLTISGLEAELNAETSEEK